MSIFGKDIDTKVANMENQWIKAEEFEKAPVLKFKTVEKIKSMYGAKEKDSIVEKNILEEGESFRYEFEDDKGNTRTHDSTSFPLFIGMQQAELNEGDWVKITREGIKSKTRYYVEVVETPKVSHAKDIGSEDSPF